MGRLFNNLFKRHLTIKTKYNPKNPQDVEFLRIKGLNLRKVLKLSQLN